MRDQKLDRLFDRFRRKGDMAALAKVFDATAPELLGLAVHLVRDVGEGEDLLQQTFLTAIEKADRYDADRRLLPWLVGILVRHAHDARRKLARSSREHLPELIGNQDPRDEAEASELEDSIKDALERLPANYSQVLEPYLLRGERAVDIARSSGKSPGTVRVQIRRGLDELRRGLPAGLTAGTGVLLGGQSLADVRVAVLEHGSKVSATSATAGASALSTTTLLGGLAMSSKLALGVLALSLLTLLGWLSQREAAPNLGPLVEAVEHLDTRPGPGELAAAAPASPEGNSREAEAAPERVEVESTKAPSAAYELALAGASGRVVDEYGAPVVGVNVRLLEIRTAMFDSMLSTPFDGVLDRELEALKWNPVVGEGRTDQDGRFELWGAQPTASHGIGIDLGGARPTLRIIDQELPSGETVQVGTIQLHPARTLGGQVIDALGHPVVGARVRAGDFPEPAFGLGEVRGAGWLMILSRRGMGGALPLPAALSLWVDNLPIPVTATDVHGRFELSGVPEGHVQIIVDHTELGVVTAPAEALTQELGTVEFPSLRSFVGRVVNSEGEALAGAQILFGELHSLGSSGDGYGVARGLLQSASDGSFRFDSPERSMICARRNARSPWTVVGDLQGETEVVLTDSLEARVQLEDPQGDPVEGAEFQLIRSSRLASLETLTGAMEYQGSARELSPGQYALADMALGQYQLRVLAPGFALLDETIELEQPGQAFEFVMDLSERRAIRVIDERTREPIDHALVSILLRGTQDSVWSSGRTDSRGEVELLGIPASPKAPLTLRVQHPAYAMAEQGLPSGTSEATLVSLSQSSGALFRLTVAGATPLEPLMIEIEHEQSLVPAFPFPVLELSDSLGQANFECLRDGEWNYSVSTRFLNMDLLDLLGHPPKFEKLASGTFVVKKGERTQVDVDLSPAFFEASQPSLTSGIEGTIRVSGAPSLEMQVGLYRQGEMNLYREWIDLPGSGAYRFEGIDAGDYQLLVLDTSNSSNPMQVLLAEEFQVQQGRMIQKDIELNAVRFQVSIFDEQQRPAQDAQLQVHSMTSYKGGQALLRRLDPGGYEVIVWGTGEFMLTARSSSEGLAMSRVDVQGLAQERFELRLSRGVPCAGSLHLPAGVDENTTWWLSTFPVDGEGANHNLQVEFEGGMAHFDMVGFAPGRYMARIHAMDASYYDLSFELPEGGARDLELHFETKDDAPAPAMRPAGSDD